MRVQLAQADGHAGLTAGDLQAAGARLGQLTLDAAPLQQLTAEVLQTGARH